MRACTAVLLGERLAVRLRRAPVLWSSRALRAPRQLSVQPARQLQQQRWRAASRAAAAAAEAAADAAPPLAAGSSDSSSSSSSSSGSSGGSGSSATGPVLQTFDYTTLAAAAAELSGGWVPAKVEGVVQQEAATALRLRTATATAWLWLSYHARYAHVGLGEAPPRGSASELFSFGAQLQGALRGLVLTSASLPTPYERVLRLGFAPRLGEPPAAELVYECMARHSNLVLLGPDAAVLAAARQVRVAGGRARGARAAAAGGRLHVLQRWPLGAGPGCLCGAGSPWAAHTLAHQVILPPPAPLRPTHPRRSASACPLCGTCRWARAGSRRPPPAAWTQTPAPAWTTGARCCCAWRRRRPPTGSPRCSRPLCAASAASRRSWLATSRRRPGCRPWRPPRRWRRSSGTRCGRRGGPGRSAWPAVPLPPPAAPTAAHTAWWARSRRRCPRCCPSCTRTTPPSSGWRSLGR